MTESNEPAFPQDPEITRVLHDWADGDDGALARIWPSIYEQLHKEANRVFQGENKGHLLQPTALVNEVWLRLVQGKRLNFQNRKQFVMFAAMTMRRILVEHARAKLCLKRGSGGEIPLSPEVDLAESRPLDYATLIAVDKALDDLTQLDKRQRKIVELRFFVGMNLDEVSEAMDISPATIKREWSKAKRHLFLALKGFT